MTGRADFICISPSGDALAWLNRADTDPRKPNWESIGTIKTNEGLPQANVRFGDIDADGRADYLVLQPDGTIKGWRNSGVQDKPAFWQELGVIFTGADVADMEGIHFIDLNGDGRDDFIHITPSGMVGTFINQRGKSEGLAPNWISVGITHQGVGAPRANVTFGRVAGSARMDYIVVGPKGGIRLWENIGHGGTRLKGDGTRYCDMTGTAIYLYHYIRPNI